VRTPGVTIGPVIGRISIVIFWLAACQGEDPAAGGKAAPLEDTAVAVVNGVAISKKEYQSTLAHAERSFSPKPGERAELARRVLEKMVADELLIQHARARGIQVTSGEVDKKLREIARTGGGEAALEAFSKQSGLDESRMRANLERNLTIERLAERMRASEKISPGEVARYYEEHRQEFLREDSVAIAHILFREGTGRGDPYKRSRKVSAEIQAGLSFAEAARKHSDDPNTRDRGGLLGTMKRGEMLPALEQVAFSMQEGAISSPVKSPSGIHLLRVLERRQGGERPLEEVQEEIRARMLDSLVESKLKELAERLTRDGNVRMGGL
jgi:foldase protein PrsA